MNKQRGYEKVGTLSVAPTMEMYDLYRNSPYTIERALCEFIDNALDAFIRNEKNLKKRLLTVQVRFSTKGGGSIEVIDDGPGLSKDEFQLAITLGNKKENPGLSEFGIGMKAAALWFGSKYTVTSKGYGKKNAYRAEFDRDLLTESGKKEIDFLRALEAKEQGFSIKLSNLSQNSLKDLINKKLTQAIWSKIHEIYQLFIYTPTPILRLVATYDDEFLEVMHEQLDNIKKYRNIEVLTYPKARAKNSKLYAIGKEKKWELDIEFEFNHKLVKGKFLILKTSSQKNNPGIRIYRENRLLKGFFSEPNRSPVLVGTANKHAPSRVFAELHLDKQPISNDKSNLAIDYTAFFFQLANIDGVKELIKQAENYRPHATKEGELIVVKNDKEYEKLVKKAKKLKNTSQDTSSGSTTTSKANVSKVDGPLIPHIAHTAYEYNIGDTIGSLVDQINDLYKKGSYKEVIACAIRCCFEIPLKSIKTNGNIKFAEGIDGTEQEVFALHSLIASHSIKNKITTLIVKKTKAASFHDVQNQCASKTKADIEAFIKKAHLGVHNSTKMLTSDDLQAMGSYLGVFLLLADQLLNNEEVQKLLNGTIPKPVA